jgi:hypothetical protein
MDHGASWWLKTVLEGNSSVSLLYPHLAWISSLRLRRRSMKKTLKKTLGLERPGFRYDKGLTRCPKNFF